jgi:hypothetical protein
MLVNYYIIKNEYVILNNDILLPNINFFVYYIDNYNFKIAINLINNNEKINNDEKIKLKIYSIDKTNYEILDFYKKDDSNNITTKIFLEYYNNLISIVADWAQDHYGLDIRMVYHTVTI